MHISTQPDVTVPLDFLQKPWPTRNASTKERSVDELEGVPNKRPVLGFEVERAIEIRCPPSEIGFSSVNVVSVGLRLS